MLKKSFFCIFCVFALVFVLLPEHLLKAKETVIGSDCTYKNKKLSGKVKVVQSFADFRVQVVSHFPDLNVEIVDYFPDACGKWQYVDNFEDFKIQFVKFNPDFKIQLVKSFPGVP